MFEQMIGLFVRGLFALLTLGHFIMLLLKILKCCFDWLLNKFRRILLHDFYTNDRVTRFRSVFRIFLILFGLFFGCVLQDFLFGALLCAFLNDLAHSIVYSLYLEGLTNYFFVTELDFESVFKNLFCDFVIVSHLFQI